MPWETMRARLLAVSAGQARAAGVAAGAEDAGLAHLVAPVDQERSGAANDRNLCTSGSVHSATTPSPRTPSDLRRGPRDGSRRADSQLQAGPRHPRPQRPDCLTAELDAALEVALLAE